MAEIREFGEILRFDKMKRCGVLRNSKKDSTNFVAQDVRPDRNLSRAWSFVENYVVPVTFILVDHPRGNNHHRKFGATDIAPLFDFEETDAEGDPELLTVSQKIHDYGWALRNCGDRVFIHVSDVVPGFEDRWKFLRAGVPLYARIEMEDKGPRARDLELYSEEELSRPSEPETFEVVGDEPEGESTHESELLLPENKSKTLLELIKEKSYATQRA